MTQKASIPPFERTVCACDRDKANCYSHAGQLLPGELARIAEFLEDDPSAVGQKFFVNSHGMIVADKRLGAVQIRTIAPRMEGGHCVFLQDGKCAIHEVAPFGCAYFDVHQDFPEYQRRANWGAAEIMRRYSEYSEERDVLPKTDVDELTHWKRVGVIRD